ncbi:NIPSNAP family protein [Candidatus Latescibacterota bacterium]
MIYQLRTYVIPPGRMPDILERFATVTMRLFERHGLDVVGFWTVTAPEADRELVYVVRFESQEAADAAWAAFREDPEWVAAREQSEANGPIVEEVLEKTMTPTSFSALQ